MAAEKSKCKESKKIELELENTVSPSQLRELKEQSQLLKPVVIVGQQGLSDTMVQEISNALQDHELIKIRIACDDSDARAEMVKKICGVTQAVLVQAIGHVVAIYRKNPEEV